jgi:hypothetical protein
VYLRGANGFSHGIGLYVLTLTGNQICAMTRFENTVLSWFGLPRSLPSRASPPVRQSAAYRHHFSGPA